MTRNKMRAFISNIECSMSILIAALSDLRLKLMELSRLNSVDFKYLFGLVSDLRLLRQFWVNERRLEIISFVHIIRFLII